MATYLFKLIEYNFCSLYHALVHDMFVKCTKPTRTNKLEMLLTCLSRVDEGSWWVGRVHVMKRRNGHTFGVLRHLIDLLVQVQEFGRQNPYNLCIEVILIQAITNSNMITPIANGSMWVALLLLP